MAKRTKKVEVVREVAEAVLAPEDAMGVLHETIHPLSVDFPNESLNNMARKINEIIGRIS